MGAITAQDIVCVIPCAGKGTRMQPLTYTRAKALLPVCNAPVLGHILGALAEAGIRRACLVVNPDDEQLAAYVKDHAPPGLTATTVPQPKPLGLGHAVLCGRDEVGDHPLMVYLGDSLYGDRVQGFVKQFVDHWPKGLLRLQPVAEPQHYGVAAPDKTGRLTQAIEKPKHPPTNLAITGLYAFRPGFFQILEDTRPGTGGEIQITDGIHAALAEEPGIWGEVYEGLWADCGRPQQFLAANAALLKDLTSVDSAPGGVRIGGGSQIQNVAFRGPVLVGRDCQISDAEIVGPCSINDGATIAGTTLSNTIVDREAHLEAVQGGIVDCIIGVGAELKGEGPNSSLVGAVVGDGSRLRLHGPTARDSA
jgi:glucose-1-phosphate thymidylyltransferase